MNTIMYSNDGDKIWTEHGWIINPTTIASAYIADSSFYRTAEVVTSDNQSLSPIHVRGYYHDDFFRGWMGVGYSTAQFTMKAWRGVDGRVWRPAHRFYIDPDTGQHSMSRADRDCTSCYLVPVDVPDSALQSITLRNAQARDDLNCPVHKET